MKETEKKSLFEQMHPGYFDQPYIRAMDKGLVYEEMTLDLGAFSCEAVSIPVSGEITFGAYAGDDLRALQESVALVDKGWVQYYGKKDNVFCAFDGERVVSFCLLDDMGVHQLGERTVRVAGPGCVGTIPAYRKRGIGLRMVQLATQILKERGYDISYIHYTGVGPWYAKLGYETLLKWNRDGIVGE
ncbi:MAG: GNAT family N-acetyltransferase [Clostridia bacterium]|nr:GNAT family N-acetyltransferase [Clostridia bacterium]